ncbi:MAG: hypothetical protein ACI36W_05835 [Coriobacteriales bacterium]
MSEELKLDTPEEREAAARAARTSEATLGLLEEQLTSSSRSKRQKAAAVLALAAKAEPASVEPVLGAVLDALAMPGNQVRWECLNILCARAEAGLLSADEAYDAAEESLFDENSGIVREAAFRLLCLSGSAGTEASERVWPLIDEAIQCHHGNGEFNDMLTSLAAFAESPISAEVAQELAARMEFDSQNARGTLRMRSKQIVEACRAK